MTDPTKAIKDALEAGVTGYVNGDDWMAIGGNTVMLNSGRPVWARIATCEHAPNADYIAAVNPTAIRSLLSRLEEAERDARRYRWLRHCNAKDSGPLFTLGTLSGETLDAAIDEAMKERQ